VGRDGQSCRVEKRNRHVAAGKKARSGRAPVLDGVFYGIL
jgi:hypothetical protein